MTQQSATSLACTRRLTLRTWLCLVTGAPIAALLCGGAEFLIAVIEPLSQLDSVIRSSVRQVLRAWALNGPVVTVATGFADGLLVGASLAAYAIWTAVTQGCSAQLWMASVAIAYPVAKSIWGYQVLTATDSVRNSLPSVLALSLVPWLTVGTVFYACYHLTMRRRVNESASRPTGLKYANNVSWWLATVVLVALGGLAGSLSDNPFD